MVLFFESADGYVIYMGADKYENEDLIKYGLPEDMWFHVDDMSSAHVYLRLKKDQRLEDVPEATIVECAQLVKANSIEGCKLSSVNVLYTRWRNLNKTVDMDVGAIGFHNRTNVKKIRVEKDQTIVNRINKTKVVMFPDLATLQQERAAEFRAAQKQETRVKIQREKIEKKEREIAADLRSYKSLLVGAELTYNSDLQASSDDSAARKFEEEFF